MRTASVLSLASVASTALSAIAPLHRRSAPAQQNPSPITATLNSFWFDVQVQLGNQTFYLLVDTGSSDTWVAKTGYTCFNAETNVEVSSQECNWNPTYNAPASLRYIDDQWFGVQYGTGIALGRMGIENVTLGGITVPEQIVGIVDRTTDKGDGINSGVLGLGFPTLTSAHPGSEFENNTLSLITNRVIYDPIFVSMYKQGLVEPWYSIAIDRLPRNTPTGPGGWLGLGELPPVEHSDDWATAPIEITNGIPDEFYQRGPEISLMTLTIDSISWGSPLSPTTNTTSFQGVVDSGNPMNLIPIEIAESFNSQFEPPAEFDRDSGLYIVDCNAEVPSLGVTIDGHIFWHNSQDLIAQDHTSGICYSTISTPAEGFGIQLHFLGDAFLKNVVAVFDFGSKEMRFAARTDSQHLAPTPTPASTLSSSSRFSPLGLCVLLGLLSTSAFLSCGSI
ncbi:hypothetical protein S7711_06522 [Stachybotrys chartarum IBT 7711]|uniref:Peptidase A1 domain-containing protein n=1 Tax=Stachybotrys chartarum (strain CBS 109288 / IBT 7711) TaxID=1280523 RepID=A0A084BBA9_STACB|nr:hypothetical protein S7711_06522 [Stachybotrys chartarum IBT 7711]